jgi:hypothetical protein
MTIFRDRDGVLWQKGSWTAALFGLRYLLFGGSFFAGGTLDKGVLFGYLVLFLGLLVGRAVGLIVRHPMLVERMHV